MWYAIGLEWTVRGLTHRSISTVLVAGDPAELLPPGRSRREMTRPHAPQQWVSSFVAGVTALAALVNRMQRATCGRANGRRWRTRVPKDALVLAAAALSASLGAFSPGRMPSVLAPGTDQPRCGVR